MESLRKCASIATGLLVLSLVAGIAPGAHSQGFTPVTNSFPQVFESSVAWGDYDNDGLLDFAIIGSRDSVSAPTPNFSNNVARIYRNNGDGTFTEETQAHLMPVCIGQVTWGDYDNDGFLDLLYGGVDTTGNHVTKLYHNNGDGTFTENTQTAFHPSSYGCVAWGDYNNDGYLDVMLVGLDLNGALQTAKLYRNNHNGSFTEVNTAVMQGVNGHSRVCFGDYDNDGYPDILLAGRTTRDWADPRQVTKLYHNNRGDGTFTEDTDAHFVAVAHGPSFFGDFNNDGFLDVIISGVVGPETGPPGFVRRDTTVIYLNNGGNGTFTAAPQTVYPAFQAMAAIGDYDADGKLDLFLNGYGSDAGLFRGNGDGTFAAQNLSSPEIAFGGVAWGDFNGDGLLDVLTCGTLNGENRDSTILLRNSGAGSSSDNFVNTPPGTPSGLSAAVSGSSVRLSWSRPSDSKTPSAGLSYAIRVGTTPGGVDVFSPLAGADGKRRVAALGAQNLNASWTLQKLAPGQYHWSVQAVDNGYAGSAFASEATFVIAGPAASVTPSHLNFGRVPLPESRKDSITVVNTGGGTLMVVKQSVSDPAFTVVPETLSVAGGDTAKFYVTFTPARVDTFTASVAFSTGDVVTLAGSGTGNGIAVYSRRSFDFGPVLFRQLKQDSLSVRNAGNAPLTLVKRTVSDAEFTVFPDTLQLAPGDSARIHALLMPEGVGPLAAILIYKGQAAAGDTLTLTGTGTVMTLAAVRGAAAGSVVSFQGVVSRAKGSSTYLQDSTGGIALVQSSGAFHDTVRSGYVSPGDRLVVNGKTSRVNSLLEIAGTDLMAWTRAAHAQDAATVVTLTPSQVESGGARYQSTLVRVTQLQLVGNTDTLFRPSTLYLVKGDNDPASGLVLAIPASGESDVASTAISNPASGMHWSLTFQGVLGQSSADSTTGFQFVAINAGDVAFDSLVTAIRAQPLADGALPTVYGLAQNYPNPFNPSTKIQFALPKAGAVDLKVYNTLGQVVATLVSETMGAGRHTVVFDAGNLASGLYFYRIQAGAYRSVMKMMLVK